MAEKNTLSILETIKKKMHKLDQKSDKSSKISDLNDEFEYISSTPKENTPPPAEVKAPAPTAAAEVAAPTPTSVVEDDLDLDALEESVQALDKAPAKAAPSHQATLDDFNLDDLDLDDEATSTPATAKESKVEELDEEEEEFSEDDVEDYEDEVDFDEEGEAEEMEEIENNTMVIENDSSDGLDWLGNKIEDESDDEESADEPTNEESDLEFPEEEEEVEHVEEEQEVEEEHDELNLDDFELPEENIPAPKQPESKEHHEDDFDFDDLDLEEEVKEEKKLPEFNIASPAPKRPERSKDIEDFLEKKPEPKSEEESPVLKEPISLEDEIDLEFEKEIMGLKPEVVRKDENPFKADEPIFQQPIVPQSPAPIQNNTAPMNQSGLMVNSENRGPAKIIYDSTLRQTSDSIKKLLDAKNVVSGISSFSQGSAFAELAMHLMEPKMEKWLNEHLPDLVEKIVREEIKKIIPKE